MPVYNKAPWLREAIDSVLRQTYRDFELIIIDDCSTDNSVGIIKTYTDPRIVFVQNEKNLGPGGTMNKIMKMARGEYVIRLDADDIAPDDRVELQVGYMDKHPNVGVSSGIVQCFGADTGRWKLPLTNEEIKAGYLFTVPICQGASIMRRSAIMNSDVLYGDVSSYIGEDRVLWFRLRNLTDFGNIDKVVLYYRRGEQNIAHDSRFDRMQIRKNIYRFFFKELGIEASEEEIDIHPFCEKNYDTDLTEDKIKRFRTWLDKLLRINEERKLFPAAEFRSYANEAWDQLFYRLPPSGYKLVRSYFKLSGGAKAHQLKYYLKYKLNKLLGRK